MLFDICQISIEGASFLDLFSGSGAIGFEALSRGARFVTFVEKDRSAIKAIEKNIESLGVKKECTLIKKDVFSVLSDLPKQEIIFADPPYERGYGQKLVDQISNLKLLYGSLFIEESITLESRKELELLSVRRAGRTFLHQFENSN